MKKNVKDGVYEHTYVYFFKFYVFKLIEVNIFWIIINLGNM